MRDALSAAKLALWTGLTVAVCGLPTVTAAQGLIFDWDGEKTVDSGKTHMKINGGAKPGEIVVSFADRKLYYFTAPGEADVYPVATPRDQSRWEGATTVTQKRENPSWTPTAHMLSENPKLPRWVPGGHPMNPLGIRALYLGASDYRIHGTDAPWTIGTPVSKGCVRMFNKDVVDLYPKVKVGTKVIVTWQKFDGKTMNIAETKGIKELPALGDPNAISAVTGKPTLANAVAGDAAPRAKARKAIMDDDSDATAPMIEKAVEKASSSEKVKAAVTSDDEPVVKKRRARKSADTDEVAKTETKTETTAKTEEPKAEAKAEKFEAKEPVKAADHDATAEPKREKRVRTAAHSKSQVKSDANVETGSLSAPSRKSEELGVAEKALAAAERAAAAAERAAAAAERAVAASQARQPVETASTPVVTPATPDVTPAATASNP